MTISPNPVSPYIILKYFHQDAYIMVLNWDDNDDNVIDYEHN